MTLFRPGTNCMGVYETTGTGVLIDACDYYRAFYHSACQARRYILMTGWQFDSEVRLVRGAERGEAAGEVSFLAFLERLCDRTPELEIYILAWDFSAIFSLEREWFQDIIFNWTTNERIHFRFDSVHAPGATHHQKLVIVDGSIAYVGGMDICSSRWDDRHHLVENGERVDIDGTPYGSYHDIQTYHTGPVVDALLDVFRKRWVDSGGISLVLPPVERPIGFDEPTAFPLAASRVAVSRTQAPSPADPRPVHEIRQLMVDAIMSAERFIYLENQYFSSQAIYWSLVARMTAPDRPRIQVVIIVPDRLPRTEELFLGLPQMKLLRALEEVAHKTGNALGVYSSVLVDNGRRKMTFIHSKLLIVDDRFLTIGSANATNRSMALDTELNVSWECDPAAQPELCAQIRRLRGSLLAEHAGLLGGDQAPFEEIEQLTSRLDCLAQDREARLCRYEPNPEVEGSSWLEALGPIALVVDPQKPVDGEYVFEALTRYQTMAFAKGVLKLGQWVIGL